MLISHSKRFIFIHIFKTAGSAVRDSFLPYARLVDKVFYDANTSRLLEKVVGGKRYHYEVVPKVTGFQKHTTANQVLERLGNRYHEYFSFAFVRNPFDWMVSLYFYVQSKSSHQDFKLANSVDFSTFIQEKLDGKIRLQSDFLLGNSGEIIVNFVGRYESLQHDLLTIFSKLNIPPSTLSNNNVSPNRKGVHYRDMYKDKDIEAMTLYFRKDLDMFGYRF